MMGQSSAGDEREQQIDEIIGEYLAAVDAGQPPDPQEWLGRHPQFAAELKAFLAEYKRMDRLTEPLRRTPAVDARKDDLTKSVAAARPAEPSGLAVGDTVRYFGDYKLLEEIARGGMGVVYRARQVSLNRIVAVKMILAGLLATKSDHDRFHSEAQAAAVLDHPNIVPVFEVGEYAGQHYFSMGYVEGTSLAARLTEGPLPPKEAAKLVANVAEAVEYAHRQGVIHRDIKPSNILIDCQGFPRITDFGLAKRVDSGGELTVTGQVMGTPSYMSPEQAAGRIRAVGPATDVYGLGALLFASLTARPPFQAATPLETLQQVIDQEPVAVRQLNVAVPRDLETIVLKCLEKSVPRRYASANALSDDLRRYLDGRPILARPVGRLEHAWRWCKRQPVVAGLIAAVAITLVAGIVVSSLFAADSYRKAKQARDEKARGDENLARALAAEAAARNALAGELRAEAHRARTSHLPGQRFETLEAIGKLRQSAGGPSRKLADEAVAALCLPDLVVDKQWRGAPQGLASVAFAPRLDVYARCDLRGNISVRRVEGDVQFAALKMDQPVDGYHSLEFSSDGRYLHAATQKGAGGGRLVRLDVAPAMTILDDRHIAFAFSPDSRQCIVGYPGNEYRLCELPSGKVLKQFRFSLGDYEIGWVCWNPRKRQIAIGGGPRPVNVVEKFLGGRKSWRIADLDSGELQDECPVPAGIDWLTWHPDGRHLAVTTSNPPSVEIYDTVTRLVVQRCTGLQSGGVPTFNYAGDMLVTNDSTSIRRLWDPASGSELLRTAAADSNSFIFGPDDRRAGFNIDGQSLQTLRIAAGAERLIAVPPSMERHRDLFIASPDGRFLATASAAGVSILDATTGVELAVVPDHEPVRFEDSGALLTFRRSRLQRWPIEPVSAGSKFRVGPPQTLFTTLRAYNSDSDSLPYISSFDSFSINGDGTVVALTKSAWSGANIVHQTKPGGKSRGAQIGPLDDARPCAVSPDGKWVAIGSFSGAAQPLTNVQVWEADSAKLANVFPVGATVSLCFSPRGSWLATISRADDECRLWRVGSWEAGPRFPGALDIAFSPDEKLLAIGHRDGRSQLCETNNGREFAILPANATGAPAHPRCFSADGAVLYGQIDWDARIHAWNLRQIRAGLVELGLEQGWPEFPIRQPDAEPPVLEVQPSVVRSSTFPTLMPKDLIEWR
jgi:serine/threonine protein kinase/WD40 repeat protein